METTPSFHFTLVRIAAINGSELANGGVVVRRKEPFTALLVEN